MTPEEATALVKRLTYRPGWKIQCYVEEGSEVFVLRCGTEEPDSEGRTIEPLAVVLTDSISLKALAFYDEAQFLRWAHSVFRRRVLHELDEWLRLDGTPLIEPHPEKFSRGILG
mgnify:CR=1 FL=1